MWEQFGATLLGGCLALLGSYVAIKVQISNVLRIKMAEELATRKISVNAQAFANIKRVESSLFQQTYEETIAITTALEEWLFDNRLFLPGDFYEHWLTMRTNIPILARRERTGPQDKADEIGRKVDLAVSACIDAVYGDMKLKRADWDRVKRY